MAASPGVKAGGSGVPPEQLFTGLLNDVERLRGERGFAVVVREAQSLQRLQALCFEQTYNTCLTARYRLQSGPVFGTLLACLLDDLARWAEAQPGFRGDIIPTPEPDSPWASRVPNFLADVEWSPAASAGVLDTRRIARVLDAATRLLRPGQRLVVFAEVVTAGSQEEWDREAGLLLERLPQRVGVVLSGPPPGFHLPSGDPRFLEIESLPGASAPVETFRYKDAAFFADQPTMNDRLGVARFADALARLVLLPETGPMTIGIHGPWGQGKSSFMQLIERSLVRHARSNAGHLQAQAAADARLAEAERKLEDPGVDELVQRDEVKQLVEAQTARWLAMRRQAEDDVVTVTFNAWQFEDATQIWAGLAHKITGRFEATHSRSSRLWTRIAYAWRFRRAQLVVDLLLPTLAAVTFAALVAILGIDRVEAWVGGDAVDPVAGVALPTTFAVAAASWFVARRAQRVLRPVSERVLEYIRIPDYRERMGFQHEVLRDIVFARDRLGRRRLLRGRRPTPRVVVFIDDLDRCSDDKIIDTLQAINLILGPDASGFYVFLGIDTAMVERAIARRYGTGEKGDHPEERFAQRYLRKIIQLSFHLAYTTPPEFFLVPETTPIENLLRYLFSPSARRDPGAENGKAGEPGRKPSAGGLPYDPSVVRRPIVEVLREVEDTPAELAAFTDFHSVLGDNPRELKRLVNAHRLIKIILQRPDVPMTAADQRKLIKWLMFSARWPDLIDDVLDWAKFDAPGDGLAALCSVRQVPEPDRTDLLKFAESDPPLTAHDLKEGGPLAFAAHITTDVLMDLLPAQGEPDLPPQPVGA